MAQISTLLSLAHPDVALRTAGQGKAPLIKANQAVAEEEL
jgi:hypothetical protein